jgi:hypothetical protein
MGKAQKIECAITFCRPSYPARLAEPDQPRLLRMNVQTKTIKSLRQYSHDPPGIFLQFKTDNEVIGKSNQEASTLDPGLDLADIPIIQHMMQEYVT